MILVHLGSARRWTVTPSPNYSVCGVGTERHSLCSVGAMMVIIVLRRQVASIALYAHDASLVD
jgi:hypothetical protein